MEKTLQRRISEFWAETSRDPLFNLLFKNSSLTRRQLETLVHDIIAEEQGVRLPYRERARLSRVSKGAYARVRKQAMNNITQAMFTILLLSYLGILRMPSFSWFIEVGELLQAGDVESLHRAFEILKGGKEGWLRPRR